VTVNRDAKFWLEGIEMTRVQAALFSGTGPSLETRGYLVTGLITLALVLAVSPAFANSARIHHQIGIDESNNVSAVKRCADELVKRAGSITPLAPQGLTVVPLGVINSRLRTQTITGEFLRPHVYVTDRSYHYDLIKLPFVFRDAPHFLAFLQSGEFYEQIRDTADQFSPPRLAIAYGGFYQMFSKNAAVTDVKHFYGRSIGGTVRVVEVYQQFGARINTHSILPTRSGLDQLAATAMGNDDKETQIVEAHLGSAIENGFKGKGRFVNLVSSSVLSVDIVIETSPSNDIGAEDLKALREWAGAAALACSEANYEKELKTLEALKQDGYQIVPFNRSAFVERSWHAILDYPHEYWTIEQFDRLVKLGNVSNGSLLPSALLLKMTPERRKKAIERDKEAKANLKVIAIK
jgi:hypothetical protein